MGGIASIVVGGITALGTQVKPIVEAYFADRRHKREIEAMDLVNDLIHANRQIEALKLENAKLRALAEHNQARLDTIEAHWSDPELPAAPAPPKPIATPVPPVS